jgi:hypothetical protein
MQETQETFDLLDFIHDLQKLTAKDAIGEIMCSNLTDEDILRCFRTIDENDTFKFNN